MPRLLRRHQHGAAALALTLVLLFVMVLAATFVHRDLVFEQRTSANQVRSTQAFEAAEAGLQWAQAHLGADTPLNADCVAAEGGTSWRERHLSFDARTGLLTPRTGLDAGRSVALTPGCVAAAADWSCRCPADGPPALVRPPSAGPSATFSLQLYADGKPGIVRLVATGCSNFGTPCTPGATAADASARIEVSLGLFGALRVPPAAALTAGGNIDAAAFTVVNTDPATGIAVHAGGDLRVAGARTVGRRVDHDATLAAALPARRFAAHFGIDQAHWKNQPAVTQVACHSDCAGAVAQAVHDRAGSALLWVDGDLDLAGPVTIGSVAHPAVLVVDGTARLSGAVTVVGLLYAGAVRWDGAATGASVRGALVAERDVQGNAAVELTYDAGVLGTLAGFAGSFVRVPGSWHDF